MKGCHAQNFIRLTRIMIVIYEYMNWELVSWAMYVLSESKKRNSSDFNGFVSCQLIHREDDRSKKRFHQKAI